MARYPIIRSAIVPDPIRIARYEKAPELGPRILFFSGGTALNALSRHLTRFTHNSIHIVTPFDSGGSSAKLREAFRMPAIGDLRSRIMALADQTVKGNPEVVRLFAFRFPFDEPPAALKQRLERLVNADDERVREIPRPMQDLIRTHLDVFQRNMPANFDLRGASVGNLILAGGYLHHGRDIDPVIFLFSRLVESRGMVVPVSASVLHLGADLEDGRRVIGQHLLTGKEVAPLDSPIRRVFLCTNDPPHKETRADAGSEVCHLIAQADLIVFPMGSFYTSIMANLLPDGVCRAIAESYCPRVYVPNTGHDPEQRGLSVVECARRLRAVAPLEFVLLHDEPAIYADLGDLAGLADVRIQPILTPLAPGHPGNPLDEALVVPALLSLA